MSHGHNIIMCNLCAREYNKYFEKDVNKIKGVNVIRNKNYNLVLEFVKQDKTTSNKHICNQCIYDIVKEFG